MSDFIKNNNWQRQIFEKVIDSFKKENIPFCILRNYENYPDKFGNDVDILISPENAGKVKFIVRNIAEEVGGRVWDYCGRTEVSRMPFTIFRFLESGEVESMHLDFLFCITQFGFEYINTHAAIEKRRRFKDFYVLDEETEFLHILLQGMFNVDKEHRERYKMRIEKYLAEKRKIPINDLRSLFPAFIASSIIKNLEQGRVDKVFSGHRIKKFLFITNNGLLFKKAFQYFPRKFKKLYNLFHPKGQFVVILGPDGVGKSTTAEIVNKLLKCFSIPAFHSHLGFRPTVLPTRQKFGLGEPESHNETRKGTKIRKIFLYSIKLIVRYFYHLTDYILGYWFYVYPRLVKGEILIAERYFYDYLLHPERKVGKLNEGFIYWTFRLFMPKPTAIILLSNDPDEILRRRQELTREEIEEVLRKSREFGKKVSRFIEIKTDKPPEEIAIELAKWIVCCNKK
jgi:thymidylate kinase